MYQFINHRRLPGMVRVTLSDLSRVPVERLAQLLLEWAADDRTLLNRLEATISETERPCEPPAPPLSAEAQPEIIGTSAAIRTASDLLNRFAQTDEPVLITGESGTGKELAARAIHASQRAQRPLPRRQLRRHPRATVG